MSATICPSKAAQAGLSSRALESPAATAGASVNFSSAALRHARGRYQTLSSFSLEFLGIFSLSQQLSCLIDDYLSYLALKHDRL